MAPKKVIVVDYDPAWAEQFEVLHKVLSKHLGSDFLAIEHVGSTSVKGLKAKPIIDLDIVIADNDEVRDRVIEKLDQLGYVHRGDLGIKGREAFKRPTDQVPETPENKTWFVHHLYVCKEGNLGLQNHLLFRDYLRAHPEEVKIYGDLKQTLAEKFPYDIDAYIDGKTDFITRILALAGLDKAKTSTIEKQNKLDTK
ncbi:MAG TPA: GrpB family protein [Microscillaceae bacterium]|nr:GrpB family protein [Microscillaceae bacterium]